MLNSFASLITFNISHTNYSNVVKRRTYPTDKTYDVNLNKHTRLIVIVYIPTPTSTQIKCFGLSIMMVCAILYVLYTRVSANFFLIAFICSFAILPMKAQLNLLSMCVRQIRFFFIYSLIFGFSCFLGFTDQILASVPFLLMTLACQLVIHTYNHT